MCFWRDVVKHTETPVQPPLDEYEKPQEIPELRVNRMNATPSRLEELSSADRMPASIFGEHTFWNVRSLGNK